MPSGVFSQIMSSSDGIISSIRSFYHELCHNVKFDQQYFLKFRRCNKQNEPNVVLKKFTNKTMQNTVTTNSTF